MCTRLEAEGQSLYLGGQVFLLLWLRPEKAVEKYNKHSSRFMSLNARDVCICSFVSVNEKGLKYI